MLLHFESSYFFGKFCKGKVLITQRDVNGFFGFLIMESLQEVIGSDFQVAFCSQMIKSWSS